jgi:hypothetical protein
MRTPSSSLAAATLPIVSRKTSGAPERVLIGCPVVKLTSRRLVRNCSRRWSAGSKARYTSETTEKPFQAPMPTLL